MLVSDTHIVYITDFDLIRRVIKLTHDSRFEPIFRPKGVYLSYSVHIFADSCSSLFDRASGYFRRDTHRRKFDSIGICKYFTLNREASR